jgi:hypothetical protein
LRYQVANGPPHDFSFWTIFENGLGFVARTICSGVSHTRFEFFGVEKNNSPKTAATQTTATITSSRRRSVRLPGEGCRIGDSGESMAL